MLNDSCNWACLHKHHPNSWAQTHGPLQVDGNFQTKLDGPEAPGRGKPEALWCPKPDPGHMNLIPNPSDKFRGRLHDLDQPPLHLLRQALLDRELVAPKEGLSGKVVLPAVPMRCSRLRVRHVRFRPVELHHGPDLGGPHSNIDKQLRPRWRIGHFIHVIACHIEGNKLLQWSRVYIWRCETKGSSGWTKVKKALNYVWWPWPASPNFASFWSNRC